MCARSSLCAMPVSSHCCEGLDIVRVGLRCFRFHRTSEGTLRSNLPQEEAKLSPQPNLGIWLFVHLRKTCHGKLLYCCRGYRLTSLEGFQLAFANLDHSTTLSSKHAIQWRLPEQSRTVVPLLQRFFLRNSQSCLHFVPSLQNFWSARSLSPQPTGETMGVWRQNHSAENPWNDSGSYQYYDVRCGCIMIASLAGSLHFHSTAA